MESELLSSLAKVLSDLQQSVENLNQSVQVHQQRVEGLAASQVILFQILVRHSGANLEGVIEELSQYAERTQSESTRLQLEFHLKACRQTAAILNSTGRKDN